ncbi:MAG: 2'-5' RNA ligase family protein [Pseudanabaena sp. LacPavin_0818_WC45_MAG_42_6]|nr:2'-5' RNA ligase family protein [Pseudanabaena sp. LacPavin_0818_WC45_MAG_42_6]
MNQRFFVALLPPELIQDQVRQIQSDFEFRYSTKATLKAPPHITLIPPFKLSSDRIEALQIDLEKFAKTRSPFTINLSGFAAFPPRVIYIDVVPNLVLPNLYVDIAAIFANTLSIIDPYASRPFVPHMTVAFRDLTPNNFEMAWAEFRDRKINFEFEATNLTLLAHDDQKWNVLSHFALEFTKASI